MSSANLNRTSKEKNIMFYQADGFGRDGYIIYNNGGFWKNNQIKLKDIYPRKIKPIFHTLFRLPPPFTYHSDGSGRDTYVSDHNGGLIKTFEPLARQKLPKFLRNKNENILIKKKIFLNMPQKRYLNKIKKIENSVVNRLYNDSLEKINKIKSNNEYTRTNSMNDIFNNKKIKIRTIGGLTSPIIKSEKTAYNQSNENLLDYNNENFYKKKIFEKFDKYKNISKNNSAQNLEIFNNEENKTNKKKLKKIKINANYTMDDFKNKNEDIYMKYNNNFNKIIDNDKNASIGNIKLEKIRRNNYRKIFGNKSFDGSSITDKNNNGVKF